MCLLPEKRSSSLLTIRRGPLACVTSTSATPELCVPGGPEPGEINGLAALQFFADMREPLIGEFRAELMKAGAPKQPRASHRAARNPAAPSFGCRGPIRLFSGLNGDAFAARRSECLVIASIIIGGAQQCLFHPAE